MLAEKLNCKSYSHLFPVEEALLREVSWRQQQQVHSEEERWCDVVLVFTGRLFHLPPPPVVSLFDSG